MVNGLEVFCDYFKDYTNQYVLIGGVACDILFEANDIIFRATRDLDIVLIIEALSEDFCNRLWEFIKDGGYRNKYTNEGNPQFYRFDKPKKDNYPKMIELFCRNQFELKDINGITPIHIADEISSLSAILLDEDYYQVLLDGKVVKKNFSVLSPEYIILFKAKAYMDLKSRKEAGECIDSKNIKKHKKDILRLTVELVLEKVDYLPAVVEEDIHTFISMLHNEPFDQTSLRMYGVENKDVIEMLEMIYGK